LHYIPLYAHPFFQKSMGDLSEYFPNMEKYYSQALSLPLYYDLSFDDVDRVAAALKRLLKR
jgi:dTDP-4-amino-4,6-dideoxygalactose transaminase